MVDRRCHQNGGDPCGQIPNLPAEAGYRRLRASTALEEQRPYEQSHRQDANEEQEGFDQGGRLSVIAPEVGRDDVIIIPHWTIRRGTPEGP